MYCHALLSEVSPALCFEVLRYTQEQKWIQEDGREFGKSDDTYFVTRNDDILNRKIWKIITTGLSG